MYLQNVIRKKVRNKKNIFLFAFWKSLRNRAGSGCVAGSVSQWYGSAGSVPKCHGSTTLWGRYSTRRHTKLKEHIIQKDRSHAKKENKRTRKRDKKCLKKYQGFNKNAELCPPSSAVKKKNIMLKKTSGLPGGERKMVPLFVQKWFWHL